MSARNNSVPTGRTYFHEVRYDIWVFFENLPRKFKFRYYRTRINIVGTRWLSRLRHCATRRKVAGSIPDGVIGIFHWHTSDRTMAPGLTQPLNGNEYQEYFLGCKGGRCVGVTTLPPSCADWNLGALISWNPLGLSRPVMVLLYLYMNINIHFWQYRD